MLIRVWIVALLAAAPSVVVGPTAASVAPRGDEIGPLVGRLRDPKLTIDEREKIQKQLLALGEDGARALQRQIEEQFERVDKREIGREKHYLDDFARAADKLVAGRLDKAALKEVDKLRDEVNALRRIENLTKEQIHEVGDPRLKRLKELLVVSPEDVVAADAELAPARQAVLDDTYELEEEFKVWAQCNAALPE